MTTRVVSNGPTPQVAAHPVAHRTTAVPTRPFQAVLNAGAQAVIAGAEGAVRRLPGGPILAAAFRPTSNGAASLAAGPAAGSTLTPEARPANPNTTPGTASEGIEGALESQADQNLYFIALQERISAENRMYTAYSNILRVRHETMKNAIGNFR